MKEYVVEHAKKDDVDVPELFIVHTSKEIGDLKAPGGVGAEAFLRHVMTIEGVDVVEQVSRYSFRVLAAKCFCAAETKQRVIEAVVSGQSAIDVVERPPLSIV